MMKNKVLKKALAPALALTLVSAVIPTPLAANALSKSDFYRYNGYYVLEVGDIVSFNDENKVNQIVGMNGSQILTGDELDLVAPIAIYPYVYSEISDRVINYTDKNGVQGSVDDYDCALSLNSLSDYEWVIEDEDGVVYETWGPEIDEVYGPYLANAALSLIHI